MHMYQSSNRSAWRGLRTLAGLIASAALLGLGGCASVYLVDNQVQSFPRWTDAGGTNKATPAAAAAVPQAPQVYRFEVLPSQTEGRAEDRQIALQALARAALVKVGWSLAEPGVNAPWTVQVTAGTLQLPRAPWEQDWYSPWGGGWGGYGFPGRDYVVTGSGQVIWTPAYIQLESPYYQRKLSLLIRRSGSGQVVYETHAAHDGRWADSSALWSAMFDAALQGFPAPPSGPRQVNIEVPR
jgi:hypothetical protein